MRFYGQYSRSRINVGILLFNAGVIPVIIGRTSPTLSSGSKYIFDLYYDKEAISKQLYDWLLKNNYADANLIAKWKKQGYEKVGGYVPCQLAERADGCCIALLSEVYSNQGDKFQGDMYMPSSTSTIEGKSNDRMCELWMSRVLLR